MNEKFNKNAKVEQLTKIFLSREEEKGLIVKDPLKSTSVYIGPVIYLCCTPIGSNYYIKDIIKTRHLKADAPAVRPHLYGPG